MDDPVLQQFLQHFQLDPRTPRETLLRQVIAAFAQLPYENLTKMLKLARREPAEVIHEHIQLGTGGTCFALTSALLHLIRALGWEVQPILADRPYGADTHSALLVWMEGRPHLVDPGYLLTEPVPLGFLDTRTIEGSFQDLVLMPQTRDRLELHTVQEGRSVHRITFKTSPVDWGQFLKVWDASFATEVVRYPVVTQVFGGKHIYLQGHRLQTRTRGRVQRQELSQDELFRHITEVFGIDARVATEAIQRCTRRGELHGRSTVA